MDVVLKDQLFKVEERLFMCRLIKKISKINTYYKSRINRFPTGFRYSAQLLVNK